jgi:hypothetical protein
MKRLCDFHGFLEFIVKIRISTCSQSPIRTISDSYVELVNGQESKHSLTNYFDCPSKPKHRILGFYAIPSFSPSKNAPSSQNLNGLPCLKAFWKSAIFLLTLPFYFAILCLHHISSCTVNLIPLLRSHNAQERRNGFLHHQLNTRDSSTSFAIPDVVPVQECSC